MRASLPSRGPKGGCPRERIFLRALAAALFFCTLLTAQAQAAAPTDRPKRDTLTAVVPASQPPFYESDQDGAPTGFAVEVLRQTAARAGYHLRFITASDPREARRLLAQGEADVLPGLGVSQERERTFGFTLPIETQPLYIYTRADAPPRASLPELKGLRVSALEGSVSLEMLDRVPGIRIHKAQSLPQALFDLVSGETDAMVFQSPLAERAAQAASLGDKLVRSSAPLAEVARALAVAPGHEDVLLRLDTALAGYRDTPAFQTLYSAWHTGPAQPPLSSAALWTFAAMLAVLAGLLLLWRYVSLVRVNRRLVGALAARDQALAELRLTRERMEALLQLTRMGENGTNDVIDFALKEGVRLTGSGLGCLFFFEKGEDSPAHTHWWGQGDAATGATALWAACLHCRAPVMDNDADAAHDNAPNDGADDGLGDAPRTEAQRIQRLMAVPLMEDGHVAVVFGVANKREPYIEADTRQLQLFLAGLWHVLGARRDAAVISQARDYAESLIEGANAMIVGLDTRGRVTVFNAAAETITGYSRSEMLGRPWHAAMLPGPTAASAAARYEDFMAGRAALPRQHEGLLRARDGRLRHLSWQNSLFKHDGAVTGTISYGIDITGHKQAAAELRRLHLAIEQAAEGVLIADEAGTVLYANPALERMTGLPRAEAQNRPRSVYDLRLDVINHHSSSCAGEGQEGAWRGTCLFAKSESAPAEVEFTVSAMRSRTDTHLTFVAVCRDVTEKRQLEHQLWQAQKMEALGTLAGGIAHDFNNLLASIMGFTELALDDLPEGSRGRGCLDRVLGASLRARELVRQILSFSRRSEHKPKLLRADAVVAEALALIEASLAKNIEIDSALAAGASILADPSQIHQIVMNLCTNAAQAMRGEGGRLTVRTGSGPLSAELAARHRLPPGDYLSLVVEDQGQGVPPELLSRIFDPFFTTKAPGEGTGLGLAVVHGIVTSLGGAVWAESKPERGARFQLVLPTHAGVEENAAIAASGDLRGRERILLVDDEPDLLELGRQTLAPLGYRVATERSPEAALSRLLNDPDAFDLVITDMNMPRLTGLQLAEGLRPIRPDLPIVLISGFSRVVPPDRLELLGAVRVLPKPFSTGELALAVRQALAPQQGGDA
ncbi:MAG: hypothetical protein AUJ49_13515 [Desulfovibrionaceae bacterium CG1_02_65_16]|nr:MAG: hypothetical protein AUJ49_13515 [Desulfovibrionaceae bacterium CG1_02_65_16]